MPGPILILLSGMVQHQVKDDANAATMRAVQELPEVVERAVFRGHIGVIGDVIAAIELRRGIMRGQPDRIDPQISEIVEPLDHPAQIADAVAVAIGKAARIDLV